MDFKTHKLTIIAAIIIFHGKFYFARGILTSGNKTAPVPENIRSIVRSLPNRNSTSKVLRQVSSSPLFSKACKCMGYWECVSNDGQVYSYCGISDSEVCCFINKMTNDLNNIAANNSPNNAFSKSIADTKAETSSTLPSTTAPTELDTFEITGNENTPTSTTYDLITAQPTPLSFPLSSSNLPDVDYFYSFEAGDGDLKQITTTLNSLSVTNTDEKVSCGNQVTNWKLDSKAEPREWPWHVALLQVHEDVYLCGGTLISNDKVLTCAHCVVSYKNNEKKLKVRLGEYDISTNAEIDPYFEVLVDRIIIHPDFNNTTLTNDIAILKLRRQVNYAANIRPICLPPHSSNDELIAKFNDNTHPIGKCVVPGWGRLSESTPFSIRLKEIIVPIWNHTECQQKLRNRFGNSYTLPTTSICAGELGHDPCDGDGGGGMTCFNHAKGQWELVGIVSFGIGCGRIDNPGVYTSVLHFVDWIDAFVYLQ